MHSITWTQKILTCPRPVNAEKKKKSTSSMHHPWRWNVTTSMVRLQKQKNKTKKDHIRKNVAKNGEPQTYNWEGRRSADDIMFKNCLRQLLLPSFSRLSYGGHCIGEILAHIIVQPSYRHLKVTWSNRVIPVNSFQTPAHLFLSS